MHHQLFRRSEASAKKMKTENLCKLPISPFYVNRWILEVEEKVHSKNKQNQQDIKLIHIQTHSITLLQRRLSSILQLLKVIKLIF